MWICLLKITHLPHEDLGAAKHAAKMQTTYVQWLTPKYAVVLTGYYILRGRQASGGAGFPTFSRRRRSLPV